MAKAQQTRKQKRQQQQKKQEGGKRRQSRKLTPWNKHVMKVFREMRAKNKDVKFSDALKAASKRKSEM
jgi:hypothetical protein